MAVNLSAYHSISREIKAHNAVLVAVSKTKPASDILELVGEGQLDFGENYVQELEGKAHNLPDSIRWHFIGHLQSNKAKNICGFVNLIHGVDSYSAVMEISKQSMKKNRVTDVLLQIHIAMEETKFGLSLSELDLFLDTYHQSALPGVRIRGLMGMATNTSEHSVVAGEFRSLRQAYDRIRSSYQTSGGFCFDILSMGMTADYKIALEEGSTMVRIGSAIFGER